MFLPVFLPASPAPPRPTCSRLGPFASAHKLNRTPLLLMSLALLALGLLCAPPAHAQGGYPGGGSGGGYPGSGGSWVPSSSAYTDSNGFIYLTPQTETSNINNTYPIPDDAASWWFGAYGPNKTYIGSSNYGSPSLNLIGHASNLAEDPYETKAYVFDPLNYGGDRDDTLALPPDLIGTVTANDKATMSVDFIWTGPGPVPAHATFLLLTHLTVGASANYGNGGATSGVSATAKAKTTLPGQSDALEMLEATAGDAGSNSQPPLNGEHLVRVTPSGNVATVSLNGEVEADTVNSLPYATWVDSAAPPGASYHGTYYYSGPGNGETWANASATISAVAQVSEPAHPINFRLRTRSDGTPDVDILDDGQLTFHYIWDSSTGSLSDLDANHCMVSSCSELS